MSKCKLLGGLAPQLSGLYMFLYPVPYIVLYWEAGSTAPHTPAPRKNANITAQETNIQTLCFFIFISSSLSKYFLTSFVSFRLIGLFQIVCCKPLLPLIISNSNSNFHATQPFIRLFNPDSPITLSLKTWPCQNSRKIFPEITNFV